MYTDIAIIGGGASGLAAAVSAKMTNPHKDVTVIERLSRTGKKIIASGNGKCNLSNINISERNYHGSIDAMDVISHTPDYVDFFTDILGVMCVTGSEGRTGGVYPRSNSATTVLNALRLKIQELGVTEMCECEITDIKPVRSGFELFHKNGVISCRKVIISAGGYAAPSFGTDGSMLRILKDMGYNSAKICPAVAPLRVNPESVKGLKGVRVKCQVSAVSGSKVLRTEKGELQFNDNNISGICVFNLAYLFQEYEGKLNLRIDLMPDISDDKLIEYFSIIRKSRENFPVEELLTGAFIKNLAVYLVKKSMNRPLTDKIKSIKNSEIYALMKNIKSLEFEVTGCSSWQNAQATAGGIIAEEIDRDLQSLRHKGLFLCGEILDVVGDCGGYNLQWAWSSGIMAGRKAAENGKSK